MRWNVDRFERQSVPSDFLQLSGYTFVYQKTIDKWLWLLVATEASISLDALHICGWCYLWLVLLGSGLHKKVSYVMLAQLN